jgi:ABC-type lipoprotein export system ATPase subunit
LFAAGTLLRPDEGEVLVAGEAPYEMSADRRAAFRAQTIGFIFQRFHLIPYLNVLDNVLAASLAHGDRNGEDRAAELLTRFGLSHRLDHCPAELSTGESQRVGLARALLNDPQLILADEPTGNLDPDSGRIVLEALAERAGGGTTILMVTHGEDSAAYATRSVTMCAGRTEG